MKKHLRNILILLLPYFIMVGVNESVRPTITEKLYTRYGVSAMNPQLISPEKCSWYCHNNTKYCKVNHVKYAKSYFKYLDPIYFGIINSLHSIGNYAAGNIVFLVILWPLIMYFLLIKSIDKWLEIRRLKNAKD